MTVGIVGHESAKFTPATEAEARRLIRKILGARDAEGVLRFDRVVSGACHLGGIDVWAIEEATAAGLDTQEFPARQHCWSGAGGYHARNRAIAETSAVVYCLVVTAFPPTYKGERYPYCYHCQTDAHIKSGGCWTVKYAKTIGKRGHVLIIPEGR